MTARALADVDRGIIHAEVEIGVAPETVYHSLTDPAELAAWWASPETYRTHDWVLDVRPGGRWSCRTTGPNGESTVGGEYLEVDPPRVLAYTWCPSWEPGLVSTVRYVLTATPSRTRVQVTHDGFGARVEALRSHEEGWTRVLGWLARHLG
jgi:uncharacterized protein YndB with AHSA1/START domain